MEKEKVNHPSHYNRENAMECIDEMELIFGKEAVKNFCLCNAWKYRYRASDKNGEEDIKKSDWYLRRYRDYIKEENKCKEDTEITYTPVAPAQPPADPGKWWTTPYYTTPIVTVDTPPAQIYCTGKTN